MNAQCGDAVTQTAASPAPRLQSAQHTHIVSEGTSTMQAAPVRATVIPTVTVALRAVESLLLGGGQRTARRNAWTAVLEDRRRAEDRVESGYVPEREAVAARRSRAT